jgi:hypothetical protein
MEYSIKEELAGHILDRISEGVIDDTNKDGWHFHCFNEDYYIIGYYEANEWLKRHNLNAFEAIEICNDYEKDNFGEMSGKYKNSEVTVNMLAYIFGEQLLNEIDASDLEELETELNEIIL